MRHAAADDDRVDLLNHVADDADLVRDLRAADDGDERMRRRFERLADVVDLLLHEEARDRLKIGGDADIRSMGAMRNAEGVVDSDVRKRRKLLRGARIVLLLFLVVAQVFEEQNLAGLQAGSCLLRLGAHAVGRPLHILLQKLRQVLHEMLRRELVLLRLRRTADVAREDQGCAVIQEVVERRQRAHHARVVRDIHLVIERHVVVDAHEDLLALDVDILDRLFVHKTESSLENSRKSHGKPHKSLRKTPLLQNSRDNKQRSGPNAAGPLGSAQLNLFRKAC